MRHQKAVRHKHHHTKKQLDYLRFEYCVGNKPVTKSAFAPQPVPNAASEYSRVLYKIVSSCDDFIRQLPKGSCVRLQAARCSTCLGVAGAGVLTSY